MRDNAVVPLMIMLMIMRPRKSCKIYELMHEFTYTQMRVCTRMHAKARRHLQVCYYNHVITVRTAVPWRKRIKGHGERKS